MVNESDDKMEGQDESEYHFSDDQINYEMETELPKASAPVAPKTSVLTKLTPYRRMIIGGVAFLAIIFFIYKVLMPSSTAKVDMAQTPVQTPIKQVVQEPIKAPVQPASLNPAPTVAQAPNQQPPSPISAPSPVQVQSFAPPAKAEMEIPQPTTNSAAPSLGMPALPSQPGAPTSLPESPMPPMPANPVAAQQNVPMSAPITQNLGAPSSAPAVVIAQEAMPPAPISNPALNTIPNPNRSIPDRISSLEDQNAKLVAIVQAQYAQKLAEYEAQNTAMQEKINELNKRFMSMEASIGKMAQMLQVVAKAPMTRMPAARPEVPKIAFSVQAIIPGRAWLKSDSGDTVTVAEGDMLKSYGRVTKIDPYDGVVDIDTGTKIVSLSYGLNGE